MQTTFKSKNGHAFTPDHFAVYYAKNGNTFKKAQSDLDAYIFSEYEDIVKIELYENGTENFPPSLIDTIYNK